MTDKKKPNPVPVTLKTATLEALEELARPMEGMRVALVCTPDGFEVASIQGMGHEYDLSRLSAMSSSMMSLALAVVREIDYKGYRRLVMQTDDGVVVIQAVPMQFNCILCMVLNNASLIGKVMWVSAEIARRLNSTAAAS